MGVPIMDEVERARMAMNGAKGSLPEEYKEKNSSSELSAEERAELNSPVASVGSFSNGEAVEMTVDDFLAATKRDHYVSKTWESKKRIVKIKKFTKGDNDRVSSPLMKKTVAIEISDDKDPSKSKPKLDVSMETFTEMEKIMVEVGLSYYQKDNRPLIDRAYIDKVLTADEFKELVTLVQEVNPEAMAASAKVEKNEQLKK
jgi:hypothetical protein